MNNWAGLLSTPPKCLYTTKSIFGPTFGHWILTFYSSLERFKQKVAWLHNFCKEILHSFLHILIRCGKGFSKMFNLSHLANSVFLHIFCSITWNCDKYFKVCKFAKIFCRLLKWSPMAFLKCIKWGWGGSSTTSPILPG